MKTLETRFKHIKEKIPPHVTLIAVSKRHSIDSIARLYQLGHRDFGENYVQELVEKNDAAQAKGLVEIRWHFIGHLQTNKVKNLLPFVSAIHTVDSLRLANELSSRSPTLKRHFPISIFVQVNVDGESTKSGILPEGVGKLCEEISVLPGFKNGRLKLEGLMAIPDPLGNLQSSFSSLRALEVNCRPYTHGFLSMGMTDDYETAIQNGATHVRIGTAIFGER